MRFYRFLLDTRTKGNGLHTTVEAHSLMAALRVLEAAGVMPDPEELVFMSVTDEGEVRRAADYKEEIQ